MAFAILRTAKLKNAAAIRGAVGHNARTRKTDNVDPSGSIKTLMNPGNDPYEKVIQKIEKAGARYRSNSVLAQEILLSASPEYFRDDPAKAGSYDKDKTQSWVTATKKWLNENFKGRMVSVHLHLDESTPHIQAVVVPLTEDNRLSARDVFSKKTLREMQTTYGESLAPLGISRGIEGSTAKHEAVKKYYGIANNPVPDLPKVDTPPALLRPKPRDDWANSENQRLEEAMSGIAKKAQGAAMARAKMKEYQATAAQAEERTAEYKLESARVRSMPLDDVLELYGLPKDPDDKKQWKGEGMRITIKGSKWFDHEAQKGGGGAIDLAMHLTASDFTGAVAWLGSNIGSGTIQAEYLATAKDRIKTAMQEPIKSAPPEPCAANLGKVKDYLIKTREIAPEMVNWLEKNNYLYADNRANAVFRYGTSDEKLGEGVEIRGTGTKTFQGYRGFKSVFMIPSKGNTKRLGVAEGAIDAISYKQLVQDDEVAMAAVAGGVSEQVLMNIVAVAKSENFSLISAFDNDKAGMKYHERLSAHAKREGVQVERHVPPNGLKDWNDALCAIPEEPPSKGAEPLLEFAEEDIPDLSEGVYLEEEFEVPDEPSVLGPNHFFPQ